jgi:ketosteroid isomerase-like protein
MSLMIVIIVDVMRPPRRGVAVSKRIENGKSYLLGMNTGDLETALAAFAEDATYYGIEKVDSRVRRKLHKNKDEIRAYIGAWLEAASGGITYEITKTTEFEGDAVLVEWRDAATGGGDHYVNNGVMVFEFHDDDTIKHARAYQHITPLEDWHFLDN